MSASAPLAELLEALPFPALWIDARFTPEHANHGAQAIAQRLRAAMPAPLQHAVARAVDQLSATRFTDEEVPSALGSARQCWVQPFHGGALVIIDNAAESHDFTHVSATMAAMLAHEIRNPLLSIKGAAQLLGSTATAEDAPLAQLIVNEVARIDQLITTLDPLAEAPEPQMEKLNVHELLGHAQLAVQAAITQPVSFELQYDPSLPEVAGNNDKLVQALVNLMKNAAEAAEFVAAPKITLSTRYVLGDTRRNAQGVRLPIAIAVADNGRGVPPAFTPNLFAPFATTKTTGRGLGLAITARIAEEHGGVVVHDAPDNGGARFTLYLPIAASSANPA